MDVVAALFRRRAEEDEGDDDGEDCGEGEKMVLEMVCEWLMVVNLVVLVVCGEVLGLRATTAARRMTASVTSVMDEVSA